MEGGRGGRGVTPSVKNSINFFFNLFIQTIKARIQEGQTAINKITSILEDKYYGSFHFKVAKLLRSGLFISTLLTNIEAWTNLTVFEIQELEKKMRN